MSTQLKPIKLWGKGSTNPPKIAILLNELGLAHEVIEMSFADLKKPEFLAINPNGRMPAIYDPNTDLTLWESGAIVEYLIEKYDTDQKLSFAPGSAETFHAKQWLFFQVSGQGPYFGQAAWFNNFHHEKLPSAIERYAKEVNRVTSVLEGYLAKQEVHAGSDGPWLVGSKYSYADLAFISWQVLIQNLIPKEAFNLDEYPVVKHWLKRMGERKAVAEVFPDLK